MLVRYYETLLENSRQMRVRYVYMLWHYQIEGNGNMIVTSSCMANESLSSLSVQCTHRSEYLINVSYIQTKRDAYGNMKSAFCMEKSVM